MFWIVLVRVKHYATYVYKRTSHSNHVRISYYTGVSLCELLLSSCLLHTFLYGATDKWGSQWSTQRTCSWGVQEQPCGRGWQKSACILCDGCSPLVPLYFPGHTGGCKPNTWCWLVVRVHHYLSLWSPFLISAALPDCIWWDHHHPSPSLWRVVSAAWQHDPESPH